MSIAQVKPDAAGRSTGSSRSALPAGKDVIEKVLGELASKNGHEPEFLQAAQEVLSTLGPLLDEHPEFIQAKILDRIVEPERTIIFRVPWIDDAGEYHVQRGFRVQYSSAIGPYKGGLRFHSSVNLSVLKFLGFEQIFKNALTTLPMGGGKGGSDFDPKGRSDNEVMRFCQSFMTELFRHIGADTDVPAGDIGVGGREVGYMFGQYRRIANEFTGVFTGKGFTWGGSLLRPEATGFGCVYFAQAMLRTCDESLKGRICLVSGSGNVAQYTVKKLIDLGAKPVTMSDSGGFIHDPDGIDDEKLAWIMEMKNVERGRIESYADKFPRASFTAADRKAQSNPLWAVEADCAFPCATQNEVNDTDAKHLIKGGVRLVAEGANMPCTNEAAHRLIEAGVRFAPGKAANAGGVATSGLEMSQNSLRQAWTSEEVDRRLQSIMQSVHDQAYEASKRYGSPGNYMVGANCAGFLKVATAMLEQGLV